MPGPQPPRDVITTDSVPEWKKDYLAKRDPEARGRIDLLPEGYMVWYTCKTEEKYKVRTLLEFMAIDVLPGRGIYLVPNEGEDLLDDLMQRYVDNEEVQVFVVAYDLVTHFV